VAVVKLSSGRERGKSAKIAELLAVAVVSAGLAGLAGCGESPNDAAKRKAAQSSNEASRITQTAGDLRPTDKITSIEIPWTAEKTVDTKARDKIIADIRKAIADDKDNKGVWKQYLEQKSVGDDLKSASERMASVLKVTGDEALADPNFKKLLQAQLGSTTHAQARTQINALQDDLLKLANQAGAIQLMAERISTLGMQGQTAGAPAASAENIGAARTTLDEVKADAAAKAAAVQTIEADIADKTAKASAIYRKTDADVTAADAAKGVASIAAYKAAVEARTEGEKLSAEVSKLQPLLAQAKTEAAVAAIRAKEADATLKVLTQGADQSTARTKTHADQSAELKAQATKLIEDKDLGLAVQVEEFGKLAKSIEDEVAAANTLAGSSYKDYTDSLVQLGTYQNDIKAKVQVKEGQDDPLLKLVNKTPEIKSLLVLGQAAAKQQAGRAQMIGWAGANLQSSVNDATARAYKAAGATPGAAPDAAAKAVAYAENARREFEEAIKLLSTANERIVSDTSAIKWLSASLKAVAYHGEYVLGDAKAKDAAKTAAQEAMSANPNLQLSDIAGAP
jgi:hypothetical protein